MLFNYNANKSNTGIAPTTNMTGATDGSFVRFAVQPLNSTHKSDLLTVINGLDLNNDKSVGNAQSAMAMEEARRYYRRAPCAERQQHVLLDERRCRRCWIWPATDAAAHATYASPATDACQANFVLYISNGPPASADDSTAFNPIKAFNGGTLPAVLRFPPPSLVMAVELDGRVREPHVPEGQRGGAHRRAEHRHLRHHDPRHRQQQSRQQTRPRPPPATS